MSSERTRSCFVFDFFNDRSLFIRFTGEAKEIDGREYPPVSTQRYTSQTGRLRNQFPQTYNNIVVSGDDDDDDDDAEVDDLFLNPKMRSFPILTILTT